MTQETFNAMMEAWLGWGQLPPGGFSASSELGRGKRNHAGKYRRNLSVQELVYTGANAGSSLSVCGNAQKVDKGKKRPTAPDFQAVGALRSEFFIGVPKIVDQLPDMRSLLIGQAGDTDLGAGLPAQKRVCGDGKKIRQHQQLHGGVGYCYSQLETLCLETPKQSARARLCDTPCEPPSRRISSHSMGDSSDFQITILY